MCKKIMEVLEILDLNNLNKDVTKHFNITIENIWLEDNMKSIKKIFEIRTKKYDNFLYYNIYLLLITVLKNLFDVNLFIRKRITINEIWYYYYTVNYNILNKHKLLILN
jgi:hypothetical protein